MYTRTALSYCSNRTLAFQEACRLGLAEVVRTFLTEYSGNDLLSEANADENALQIAVKNRRSNIVQILLGRYQLWIKSNIMLK